MSTEGFRHKLVVSLSLDAEEYSSLIGVGDDAEAEVRTIMAQSEIMTILILRHNCKMVGCYEGQYVVLAYPLIKKMLY